MVRPETTSSPYLRGRRRGFRYDNDIEKPEKLPSFICAVLRIWLDYCTAVPRVPVSQFILLSKNYFLWNGLLDPCSSSSIFSRCTWGLKSFKQLSRLQRPYLLWMTLTVVINRLVAIFYSFYESNFYIYYWNDNIYEARLLWRYQIPIQTQLILSGLIFWSR